jgi:hypothetical protein
VPIAIGIDHHARGDEVAARRIVDVSCGSCTALLVHVIDALGVPLATGADARGRGSVAEALYLGLATDTGWFRFQNARAPEFALAARLLGAGVDKDYLLERIEQSHRESRLRIEAKALSSVQFIDLGGRGTEGRRRDHAPLRERLRGDRRDAGGDLRRRQPADGDRPRARERPSPRIRSWPREGELPLEAEGRRRGATST